MYNASMLQKSYCPSSEAVMSNDMLVGFLKQKFWCHSVSGSCPSCFHADVFCIDSLCCQGTQLRRWRRKSLFRSLSDSSLEVLKSVVTGQSGFNFTCGCLCGRQICRCGGEQTCPPCHKGISLVIQAKGLAC